MKAGQTVRKAPVWVGVRSRFKRFCAWRGTVWLGRQGEERRGMARHGTAGLGNAG